MSAQEYDRWMILPPEDWEDDGQPRRDPKYSDREGIRGSSGTQIDASRVGNRYTGLTRRFPEYGEWYIVRMYGDETTLDAVVSNPDVRDLTGNPNDIEEALRQQFPDIEGSEWGDRFFIGAADPGNSGNSGNSNGSGNGAD